MASLALDAPVYSWAWSPKCARLALQLANGTLATVTGAVNEGHLGTVIAWPEVQLAKAPAALALVPRPHSDDADGDGEPLWV